MPTARNTGHRIRSGTHAAAAITSTYDVSALTQQADQTIEIPWVIARDDTLIPRHARIVKNADGSKSRDGFVRFKWRMSYMTFLMMDFWLDSFLASGAESANVTVRTFDEQDAEVYYQGIIYRPPFDGQNPRPAPGGWADVVWEFDNGVTA